MGAIQCMCALGLWPRTGRASPPPARPSPCTYCYCRSREEWVWVCERASPHNAAKAATGKAAGATHTHAHMHRYSGSANNRLQRQRFAAGQPSLVPSSLAPHTHKALPGPNGHAGRGPPRASRPRGRQQRRWQRQHPALAAGLLAAVQRVVEGRGAAHRPAAPVHRHSAVSGLVMWVGWRAGVWFGWEAPWRPTAPATRGTMQREWRRRAAELGRRRAQASLRRRLRQRSALRFSRGLPRPQDSHAEHAGGRLPPWPVRVAGPPLLERERCKLELDSAPPPLCRGACCTAQSVAHTAPRPLPGEARRTHVHKCGGRGC